MVNTGIRLCQNLITTHSAITFHDIIIHQNKDVNVVSYVSIFSIFTYRILNMKLHLDICLSHQVQGKIRFKIRTNMFNLLPLLKTWPKAATPHTHTFLNHSQSVKNTSQLNFFKVYSWEAYTYFSIKLCWNILLNLMMRWFKRKQEKHFF
jgi:hypothetical protein